MRLGFLRFDRPAGSARPSLEARMRLHRTERHRINRLLVMRSPDVVGPGNIRGHADRANNDAQCKVRMCRWKNGVAKPARHGLWVQTGLNTLQTQAP
jgi:hypothetical protein